LMADPATAAQLSVEQIFGLADAMTAAHAAYLPEALRP